jgi:hypothetical protein
MDKYSPLQWRKKSGNNTPCGSAEIALPGLINLKSLTNGAPPGAML